MRMGECEKECMGTQREKCTEFERLSGEQILGYEIRLTPGLPWKLCFINLSLSPGALVYDIYTEVTNIHPYFTFYTHTIVRVCVLICAGFFFGMWACVTCTRESSLLSTLLTEAGALSNRSRARWCDFMANLASKLILRRIYLVNLLRLELQAGHHAHVAFTWLAECLNSCPQAGALTTEASPQPVLPLFFFLTFYPKWEKWQTRDSYMSNLRTRSSSLRIWTFRKEDCVFLVRLLAQRQIFSQVLVKKNV